MDPPVDGRLMDATLVLAAPVDPRLVDARLPAASALRTPSTIRRARRLRGLASPARHCPGASIAGSIDDPRPVCRSGGANDTDGFSGVSTGSTEPGSPES